MKTKSKAGLVIGMVMVTISILWIYQSTAAHDALKQSCLKYQKDILAGQSGEDSAVVASQVSDFNAKCGETVGAGNELSLTSTP